MHPRYTNRGNENLEAWHRNMGFSEHGDYDGDDRKHWKMVTIGLRNTCALALAKTGVSSSQFTSSTHVLVPRANSNSDGNGPKLIH